MDMSSARPPEEARAPRESAPKPQASDNKTSQGQISSGVQGPSEAPQAGGVLAASHTESGSLRDNVEKRQTIDHSTISDMVRKMTRGAGDIANTRLAIEVDVETNESRFLVLSRETGEVLRQIPQEDVLSMLREASQLKHGRGIVVNRHA